MALVLKPTTHATPEAAEAARVRACVTRAVRDLKGAAADLADCCRRAGGPAKIAAALGAEDGPTLATFYARVKAALQAVGETVPDLGA